MRFTCGFICTECGHEEHLFWDIASPDGSDGDRLACLPFREERDKAAELHAKSHTPHGEHHRWRNVRILGVHDVSATCNCGGCRKETGR